MMRRIACSLSVCALLLPLASCGFLSGPDYELLVTIESGVSGSPETGVQAHADLETVDYSYAPLNAKHTVEVMIDGGQETASGSLIIYHNTTLVARLVDIRGAWKVTSVDDDSKETVFTVTFDGADILGGTFSDSRGYHGTWTGVSGIVILHYSDLEKYIYTGALFSMEGSYTNGSAEGTWSAKRTE